MKNKESLAWVYFVSTLLIFIAATLRVVELGMETESIDLALMEIYDFVLGHKLNYVSRIWNNVVSLSVVSILNGTIALGTGSYLIFRQAKDKK